MCWTKKIIDFRLSCLLFLLVLSVEMVWCQDHQPGTYTTYRGKIIDARTNQSLEKVQITLDNTNIGSISNADGEFSLKVPQEEKAERIRLTLVGYNQKFVDLKQLEEASVPISLEPSEQQLDQVELYKGVNPKVLVENALARQKDAPRFLTGFYREGVTKGSGRNVMLAESVLQIDKKRAVAGNRGRISLYRSRKNTDYKKLDTTAVKLRGGPYNPLYSDIIQYPEFLFYGEEGLDHFIFEFEEPTTFDNRYVFVVYFEDGYKREPYHFGRFYIDAKTNALLKLEYQLNVEDKYKAERMLVAKKPRRFVVTPLEVSYEADYLLNGEQSEFNYSRFFIKIRVKKKGRLFNRRFSVNSELLITDRGGLPPFPEDKVSKIRPNSIISDDIKGFGEEEFWGKNNIIEPERSLERTFNMIWRRYQRQ